MMMVFIFDIVNAFPYVAEGHIHRNTPKYTENASYYAQCALLNTPETCVTD